MPELPEVETVCRGLAKKLKGKEIARITTTRDGLRFPFPKDLKTIRRDKIKTIERRAKYVQMRLSSGAVLLLHLGMSGRLLIVTRGEKHAPQKHDHMRIEMQNGTRVIFNDPRRFGIVDLCAANTLQNHKLFRHLGIEPLTVDFNAAYLLQKLKNKKTAIKLAIMDQRIVVGVGNIYASEALYMSGISPKRRAGSLKKDEAAKLAASIKKVLQKAIAAGGSSLRDYVQTDGELGYFQHRFSVYGRDGAPCKKCKTPIMTITQGGRSTFYCPRCQK